MRFIFHLLRYSLVILLLPLVITLISNDASASQLFSDDFTDNDGVSLSTHNSLWEGYSSLANAIISNNEIVSNNNSSYYLPSLLSQEDYCVQASFSFPLPYTNPENFFDISTRRNSVHGTHNYSAGLTNNSTILFLTKDYSENSLFSTPASMTNGMHTLKLCSVGDQHSMYLDGTLLKTVNDSTYSSGAPGFDLGNNAPIDNFLVTSADEPPTSTPTPTPTATPTPTPTSTPTPTPTPTATPTPTPTPTPLPVPEIKQTNSFWKSQVYDSANRWSPRDPTIGSWGCALTSAVMVLNYYELVKLPDGTALKPHTLNKWLKKQKDGYVGNGLVNWIAISRLTKLAKDSGYNPNFHYDALEYSRRGANDFNQLTTDIENGHPDILEVPGHFVVAKGIQSNTFIINDPYFSYTTLSQNYNNSFKSLGRYTPSNTDLSYILIIGPKDQSISLVDSGQHSLGNSFIQDPLTNDNSTSQKAGDSQKVLLLKSPATGDYKISILGNNNSKYSYSIYSYDTGGSPKIQTLSGFIGDGKTDTLSMHFDKNSSGGSKVVRDVDFSSTIEDINEAMALKKLNPAVGYNLITILDSAQLVSPFSKKSARAILKSGQRLIKHSQSKLLTKDVANILNEDFTALIKTL